MHTLARACVPPGHDGAAVALLRIAIDETTRAQFGVGTGRACTHQIVEPDAARAAGIARLPRHLRRALAEVRRTGVAYAREELTLGSLSVAAPVVGKDDAVVAALAVVLDQGRGDLRRLAPAVRTAAISTSRALQERQRLTLSL